MSYLKIINEFENYFVVDSMPLEAVKLRRSKRTKICKEEFIYHRV